jgi:hypothetical protein
MNRDVNRIAITGQRFIDRIIYYFVNQVMQTNLTRRSNVHRRSFAHRVTPFEDSD